MGKLLDNIKNEIINLFQSKKNLVNLLLLGIMILALPLTVKVVREQQIVQSRAVNPPIVFKGDNVSQKDGKWVASKPQITLELTSPFGPPAGVGINNPTPSPSAGNPTPSPSPSVSPSPSAAGRACSGNACTDCILNKRDDVLNYYKNNGWDISCANQTKVKDDWCKIDASGCQTVKSGACASACSTTSFIPSGEGFALFSPVKTAYAAECECEYVDSAAVSGHNECTSGQAVYSGNCTAPNYNPGCSAFKRCVEPVTSCPAGQDKVKVDFNTSKGYLVNNTIVGSDLNPYKGTGECGYKYYVWKSTLPSGEYCVTYSFGKWDDQTKCPKQTGSPPPASVPPGGSVTTKCGTTKTWAQIDAELKTAGWPGPFDHSQNELTAYNNTVVCPSASPSSAPSSSPAVSPSPQGATTVAFRVAENPADFAETGSNGWQVYTSHPMKNISFEFKDKKPGQKSVFVEFKDSTLPAPNVERKIEQITLLGSGPAITGCSLNFEDTGAVFVLSGQNFGSDKGAIKSGETSLSIREWKDDSVKVVWSNAPQGVAIPIILTSKDGQSSQEAQCSAISQLALGAKFFCRAPSTHDMDDVDITLAGVFKDGTKLNQKIRINRDGSIAGLNQKLEAGKRYRLSIKAPGTLRRTVEFTASGGTTNIPDFVLPVGDIFPADGGDGVINSLDKAELNRQWIISQSASGRSGDFNRDGRVNSIDWACMRFDFGDSDQEVAVPGAPVVSPSPSANPSVSPSPSASPSPSPSPTITQVVSLSPQTLTSGASLAKLWTTTFSNSADFKNIKNAFILISVNGSNKPATDPTFFNGYYNVADNKFYVWDPGKTGGEGWIGGFTPGSAGSTIAVNSFGLIPLLNGNGTNTNGTGGKNLVLNWYITSSGGAKGKTYKIFLRAQGKEGTDTGWVEKGSWTIN
ncbi:MAG: hypothetical protein ACD_38C00158G0006 [uncultured bacterium]|uniref:Cellulose-binding, family II n=1 Tax=Candidatus Daviesbacteria bacterium GW2011_GWC2_40_12 TaxID=1618431 RepID=A0A0G0QWD2_9BACT|nr:MAG: hypothetical protein ACD_38C00158G0006 [uncultured bacterium]KKR16088.1 MAG: Cellulose-binding, family II [Candidatus Daviesbacteria bacterium GW2011_GWA2_39_33]KKR41656.1 MAG: Cellulose-binding, family II [Candidatus Daviesbacteria bacterium GW2011_GWC2_40_12]OGE22168.1 MAG: hypothetical protein A2778_03420 [Candidatus Daviesbacteria bacterium RIFCSPHIGHO2_01_FULL_40_24]OGE29916.1 MAG: hypothetical protein A3C29_00470 [Candidatus Daviesbacteria bacterium RIFCSPHIGHO2_02_FULL_40_16]OGE